MINYFKAGLLLLCCAAMPLQAREIPEDPWGSVMWKILSLIHI